MGFRGEKNASKAYYFLVPFISPPTPTPQKKEKRKINLNIFNEIASYMYSCLSFKGSHLTNTPMDQKVENMKDLQNN